MGKFMVAVNTADGTKYYGLWCNNSVEALMNVLQDESDDGVHLSKEVSVVVKREE